MAKGMVYLFTYVAIVNCVHAIDSLETPRYDFGAVTSQPRFRVRHAVERLDMERGLTMTVEEMRSLDQGTYLVFARPLTTVSSTEATLHLGHADEWTAWYRLVPQKGLPVVAELRVLPNEDPERLDGRWSGSSSSVPKGGLRSRLATSVRPDQIRRLMHEFLQAATDQLGEGFTELQLSRTGDYNVAATRLPAPRATGPRRLKDTELAEIAALYSGFVLDASPRPIHDTAEKLDEPKAWVRDRVARARRAGILTRAPGRGLGEDF